MSRTSEIVTAVATLGCAIGVGFVMQRGDTSGLRYGAAPAQEAPAPQLVGEPVKPAETNPSNTLPLSGKQSLNVKDMTLTSAKVMPVAEMGLIDTALIEPDKINVTTTTPSDAITAIPDPHEITQASLSADTSCEIRAEAETQPGAMLRYMLTAPCAPNAPVAIEHNGMRFHELTSETGTLVVDIPALAEAARIEAVFEDGDRLATFVRVDTAPLYDRVVVQWAGDTGVQLHAREFGAGYGEDGHVWADDARNVTALADGQGGFLTGLGNLKADANAWMAEIYTFPAQPDIDKGQIDLTVETEVTHQNCDSEVIARALQFKAGKEVSSQLLSLSVPDCDAIGSFLVLNNLLQDLTVASK